MGTTEERLRAMLAWAQGKLPSEGASYAECHAWMDAHGMLGEEIDEEGDRGREIVERWVAARKARQEGE